MLKRLLEKVFGVEIKKVQKKEAITKHDNVPTGGKTQTTELFKEGKTPSNLKSIDVEAQVRQISDAIIALGYKAIPDIMRAYHHSAVEKWCELKQIELGYYDRNNMDIEAMSLEQLIKLAEELNQLGFRQRMIEEGKARVSAKQEKLFKDTLAKCKKIDKNYHKVLPDNKFDCSDDIQEMFEFLNSKRVMVGNITEGQYKMLKFQTDKLGKEYTQPNSIEEASRLIEKYNKEIEDKGIDTTVYATEKQKETAKRYYKLIGKRWNKSSQAKWDKLPINKASEEISEMKEKYLNAEASPDRINYLKQVAERLNAPLAADISLTNKKANELSAKFNKRILNKMAEVGYIALTSEEINTLSPVKCSELIKQIKVERKSQAFEKSAEEIE